VIATSRPSGLTEAVCRGQPTGARMLARTLPVASRVRGSTKTAKIGPWLVGVLHCMTGTTHSPVRTANSGSPMTISSLGSTPTTPGVRICAPNPFRSVRSQAATVPSSPEEYAPVPSRFTARAWTVPAPAGSTSRRTQRPRTRSLTTSRWSAAVTSTDPAASVAAADTQLVWSAIRCAGRVAPGGYQ
jgi:hypothetical protein